MPLPDKYTTLRGRFDKLKRQANYLNNEVGWELFNEFAITAFHLCDWILSDPKVSPAIIADMRVLQNTQEIQACRDIANTIKHREITRYTPTVIDATADRGFGVGRFGRGGFGVGEESILITLVDGTIINGLTLSEKVIELWEKFFEQYPQLLDE